MTRRDPKQKRSRDKVEKILAAARSILVEEGPAALTTRHLAEVSGLGLGTLYQYFDDKDAVIESLREQIAEEDRRALQSLLDVDPQASLVSILTEVLESYLAMRTGDPGLRLALARMKGAHGSAEWEQRLEQQFVEDMAPLLMLKAGLESAEAQVCAMTMIAMADAVLRRAQVRALPQRVQDELQVELQRWILGRFGHI